MTTKLGRKKDALKRYVRRRVAQLRKIVRPARVVHLDAYLPDNYSDMLSAFVKIQGELSLKKIRQIGMLFGVKDETAIKVDAANHRAIQVFLLDNVSPKNMKRR